MTPSASSIHDLLAQYRSAYLHTLPGRLAQLEVLATQLGADDGVAPVLPALGRFAHSLAGSAGTFGLDALGGAARELELLVDAIEAEDGDPGALPMLVSRVRAGLAAAAEVAQ